MDSLEVEINVGFIGAAGELFHIPRSLNVPGHDVGGAAVGEVGQVDLVLNLVDLVLELGQVQHAAVSGP